MALTPGTRLGVYDITAQIGEGGMGQVYQATDTRLKRQVAIKILPPSLAADPDRLARFQREAEVLASLNHPNIAAIYGLEESGGMAALVMELVEGPTLAERIARSGSGGPQGPPLRTEGLRPEGLSPEGRRGGASAPPIPMDEALPIARQIAEALDAAHAQGIIHRDLKPANIKVRADGTVKVLDFGLAKAMEPTGAMAVSASMSPTITTPAMTQAGMILGTAAYMSPEQARGKTVDKRADIWAFGAVLFEMLTGCRPFDGEDMTEVLGAVVRLEPPWEALPSDVPPPVRTLLQSCLVKDPRRRVADISTALFVLDKVESLGPPVLRDMAVSQAQADAAVDEVRRVLARATRRRVALAGAAAAIASGAIMGATVWYLTRPTPPLLVRTEVTTSGAAAVSLTGVVRDLAITPDGSRIVYRGNSQLLVRALDQLVPASLTGLGNPRGPFVSPDGQWVGFFAFDAGTVLQKVAITGGPPVTVARVDGAGDRGATWGEDDTIIYATNGPATGLQRVSAAGGEPSVLTKPNREAGEADHYWPEFLPGGQAVLFTITPVAGSLDNAQIAVLDLRTNTQTVLVRGGSHAHYVPSGHLVYGAGGTLRAVGFDLARLAVVGTPVPVVEEVRTTVTGAVDAVVAANGTLAYVSGGVLGTQRTLVWVDRTGREEPIKAPPRAYAYAQISPDGSRVALDIRDEQNDIWIWDLARETLQRLTFDPGMNRGPVWTPDGTRVAFSRAIGDGEEVYWQAADGSGMAEPLTEGSKASLLPSDFSPGAAMLLYEPTGAPYDIGIATIAGRAAAGMPLLASPANESSATVSPDGRWLAYRSDESGRDEVYVRPFPAVNTGRWQISTGGGTKPRWSRDGRELFYYVGRDGVGVRGATMAAMMAVSIKPGPGFAAGAPSMLFQGNYLSPQAARQVYDVSPDGKRFLMIKPGEGAGAASPRIIVVQNWTEELKRLVPAK